ncbi:MAG TPA: hypothetical protein VII58_02925 [Acidobacteriaceae bacterium]
MTVLKGCDSWWEPNATQLASAKSNGVAVWAGYFSTGSDGIYRGWSDAAFDQVMAFGLKTLAFCSTRADPAAWKARAAKLGIVTVADVESSVNGGDGPTVDPWLAASGARLYGGGPRGDGTIPRHLPHGHPGYMVADYEARPGWSTASWPGGDPKPVQPVAWQFQGGATHPWGNTDLGIYDEAFVTPGGIAPSAPEDDDMLLVVSIAGNPNAGLYLYTGAQYIGISTPADEAIFLAAAKQTAPVAISATQHTRLLAASTAPPAPTTTTVPVNAVLTGTISGTLKG